MVPCCTPVPLVSFAWLFRVLRSIRGIGVHRIDHEARIHRGNFRMAEWVGRLPSRRVAGGTSALHGTGAQ